MLVGITRGDHWVTQFSFSLRLMYEEVKVLQLDSTFVGFFSVVQGEENMDMERFVQSHSPALMFPYIREHISAVTQKAGVKTSVIAPVNVLAMLKDAKGRTSDADEADQFVSLDPGGVKTRGVKVFFSRGSHYFMILVHI